MTKEDITRAFMNAVWNNKRKDLIEAYVNDQYKVYLDTEDPWEGRMLNRSEFSKRLDYSFNSFPDLRFEITSAIGEADHVAITWIMTGTNLGPIGQYPATGKRIKTTGMTIYYFDQQLICGHSQVYDRANIIKQLGLLNL